MNFHPVPPCGVTATATYPFGSRNTPIGKGTENFPFQALPKHSVTLGPRFGTNRLLTTAKDAEVHSPTLFVAFEGGRSLPRSLPKAE